MAGNDIHVRDPRPSGGPPAYVKVGGILANCAYSAGSYQIVLGIGINTNNGRPTTSLDALLPLVNEHLAAFRIERLIARILARLETLYGDFCRDGFSADLEERYYHHWPALEPDRHARGRGRRSGARLGHHAGLGMLKAEEVRDDGVNGALRGTGKMWALQSDENSFDFWKGLVRRKV